MGVASTLSRILLVSTVLVLALNFGYNRGARSRPPN
jgi:hypothetical protein